jgi:hypothetical protein
MSRTYNHHRARYPGRRWKVETHRCCRAWNRRIINIMYRKNDWEGLYILHQNGDTRHSDWWDWD